MRVDVVCLRREGVKLSAAEAKAMTPIRGHLKYGRWLQAAFAGQPQRWRHEASLHVNTDDRTPSLLPALLDAAVSKIDIRTGSMLIVGAETIRLDHRPVSYLQTWWCRVAQDAMTSPEAP